MKIKHIKSILVSSLLTALIISPLTADDEDLCRGALGYSAVMLYFVGNGWDAMPEIYLDEGGNGRDMYYEPLLLHGIDGYVTIYGNWRLGVNFHSGSGSRSAAIQDSSVMIKLSLASSGLTVAYAAAIDPSLSVAFATEFGMNRYSAAYMLVRGEHDWDNILDARKARMTQNELSSDAQFYTRLKISMHYRLLEKLHFKLSSGFNISPLSQTKWSLDGYVPVSAADDIILLAPFLNAGIMLGF